MLHFFFKFILTSNEYVQYIYIFNFILRCQIIITALLLIKKYVLTKYKGIVNTCVRMHAVHFVSPLFSAAVSRIKKFIIMSLGFDDERTENVIEMNKTNI